jgi:hypothetical protein
VRLHEELIKQGILHPEKAVRSEAVLYFSRSYANDDDSILPLAISAIEQYGWDEAFIMAACITGLPLSDATLPWVLAQLQHQDAKKLDPFGWPARWHTLHSLLSNADAELLARHKQAILDVKIIEAEVVNIVGKRIDLLTADAEFCRQELEKFCVASKDIDDIDEVDLDRAYALCEAIARQKEKFAEKVLDILSEKIEDFESNPKVWMEGFAVRMAGEMRLEAAIPLVIAKLEEDDEGAEWLNRLCEETLEQIGGDAVIRAVADMYRQGGWNLRMTACDLLQHIHSDLAVSTILELLPGEEDSTIRTFLATGSASHLAFETIEPLRQLVLDGRYDESFADLKQDIVVAATLMNVEFPERELWKDEVEKKRLELEKKLLKQRMQEEAERLKQRKDRLEAEKQQLIRQRMEQYEGEGEGPPSGKVGRNDPCPCGSGKKFKKCCLNKQRTDNSLV